ncbi:MAG: protein kinase [Myxococcales bacterium]
MDGSSASARQGRVSIEAGEVLGGRYRVERLLGEGGMAAVYAVIDAANGERKALKLLTAQAKHQMGALFEREYRTLSGLRHRGIVEVFEYGIEGGRPFYTMELLEGQELTKLAPLPWREACTCVRDIAAILGLLHARGLIHRDLSPRNLFRCVDGRVKLLDFGALAAVGEVTEIVGTAPFLPPEALDKRALDGRADLYSLGALAYWLLTGVHAYPAKNFAELPRLWQHETPLVNSMLKLLKQEGAEVPAELEILVQSMLRLDPTERPADTAEVIARLTGVAGLDPEGRDEAAQGYLDSKVFVGRERERERFAQKLASAQQGNATTLFVEGTEGVGRSRLLEELTVMARVAGSVVLRAQGSSESHAYGLASNLACALLQALPEDALELAQPHADALTQLSPELRRALGRATPAAGLSDVREDRLRKQAALHGWFVEVSQRKSLAIMVDDLPLADEESQAFLATLAHAGKGPRLLVTVTAATGTSQRLSSAAQSMRGEATRLWLLPLTAPETRLLLRSVFGETRYLDRMAERLHKLSEGNPRYCLELARNLVRSGTVRYADGMWALPSDISADDLPKSLEASVLSRLDRLSPEARDLARLASVPDNGFLTPALFGGLTQDSSGTLEAALSELVETQVLRNASGKYRFAHPLLRDHLHAELPDAERRRVHLALGAALASGAAGDDVQQLRASLHFLRAGDVARGEALLLECGNRMLDRGVESVGEAAPMFDEAVTLLDGLGRDKYSLIIPLSMLSFAGYFADRRYGMRHGERALSLLQDVLRMNLARKLRRFLGARIALLVSLVVAGIGLRRAKLRAPNVTMTVRCLLSAASTLAGMTAIAIDPRSTHRHAAVIEPLTALGPQHAATFLHRFCLALAMGVEDRPAESVRALKSLIEWLESDQPIHNMPAPARRNYLAGSLFTLGIRACWKDGNEGLAAAEKLEQFGPLYAMYADQLRAIYYSNVGDLERSQHYRKRVEVHAIQLGGAWQVETWAPADATKLALWTNDAVSMKRTAQDLARLAVELPSFQSHERRARAAYLVMRGKGQEAIPLLTDDEEPLAVVGWSRTRSQLVRALREVGDPARSHAVGADALSRLSTADLEYVAHTLTLQVEFALTEAALGRFREANARLDQMIAHHTPLQGLLVLSVLHQARMRVALLQNDLTTAQAQLAELERYARPTGIPSLLESVNALKRELARALNPGQSDTEGLLLRDPARLVTHVEALMTRTGRHIGERASRAVQIALELTGADAGFLVVVREDAPLAEIGGRTPDASLVAWAKERLLAALRNDETAQVEDRTGMTDLNLKFVGDVRYCVTPLWVSRNRRDVPVAAIALGFSQGNPQLPSPEVLRVIGGYLEEADATSDIQTIS